MAALGLHGGEYASINEIEKHNRNIDAAHDQAVRQEREVQTSASATSPGGSINSTHAPADEMPWPETEDPIAQGWKDWIESIKTQLSKATATWQIKKLGEKQNTNFKSLRQFNSKWAEELEAFVNVRWEQINTGER